MTSDFPTMVAPSTSSVQGGYTDLLIGLHQDASTARKLHFDEAPNH